MIAFSYRIASKEAEQVTMSDSEWQRTIELRDKLNELEERNLKLQNELNEKQSKIMDIEKAGGR